MNIPELTAELTRSLRRPTRKTLSLINKALSYLTPFESAQATTTSRTERAELLAMISTHRWTLCPYLDLDRIESNLRRAATRALVNGRALSKRPVPTPTHQN